MSIKPSSLYNEPLLQKEGDIVPQFTILNEDMTGKIVAARLELEKELRECGLTKSDNGFKYEKIHSDILISMLTEMDSPMSAALRANAAGIVGPVGILKAVPIIKSIALDENDDLKTRLNSIGSYFILDSNMAANDLNTLLNSSNDNIRIVTYLSAFRSGNNALIDRAKEAFKNEDNSLVRASVIPKTPALQVDESTVGTSSAASEERGGVINWLAIVIVLFVVSILTFIGWKFFALPVYFVPAVALLILGVFWTFNMIVLKRR